MLTNFLQKIVVFLEKNQNNQVLATNKIISSQKNGKFFSKFFFRRRYFQNHNIGPSLGSLIDIYLNPVDKKLNWPGPEINHVDLYKR
jgi:hypothetical protein